MTPERSESLLPIARLPYPTIATIATDGGSKFTYPILSHLTILRPFSCSFLWCFRPFVFGTQSLCSSYSVGAVDLSWSLAALRFAALLAIVLAATLHAQPTFRTMVDLVTVPVVVTASDGSRVGDLDVGDFRVWEDGVPQNLSLVSRDPRPLSICILLDSSPSMAGREVLATRAIDTILARLHDDDEAALLMFASTVKVALPWTRASADALVFLVRLAARARHGADRCVEGSAGTGRDRPQSAAGHRHRL